MEEYLLDRATLGQFVDELMKKRPLPVDDVNGINQYRESQMKALDERISQAIFGSLDASQSDALGQLLDQESEDPEVFRQFFESQGLNIEQTIASAINSFSADYLAGGGQNV